MIQAAIATQGLTKRFGSVVAVDGLELRVARGEIFGFLGPNGAGKTTSIRLLTGVLVPTAGSAEILGHDLVIEREAIRDKIGYVAQHFGLYGDLTVAENVRFYGDLYVPRPTAEDLEYRDALIERYGLGRYRKTRASALSGGFKQRLALITAITHRPSLIFLDEPTAGVDPVTRKELWDLFYELAYEGATLFVTTHYMEEAERCDRLAFIFGGRVVVENTPAEIRRSLAGREVFAVRGRYDRGAVERARGLAGVETINQFGTTMRVVVRMGLHTPQSLAAALEVSPAEVSEGEASIEDVFVNLTERNRG